MIKLFESSATSYETLGLGNLTDCAKAVVVEERNGEFELEIDYPIDGIHYKDILLRSLIVCKPNPYDSAQAFRVYYISKPINGIVTIKAAHLSYDLSGVAVNPYSANSVADALNGIKKNAANDCPFNFSATKTGTGGFNVDEPTSARAILGGSAGSVLDVYGKGEYEFDNFNVKLHLNRGSNNGVSLRYGKNITDLTQEENCNSMYTGVYPFWKGSVEKTIKKIDDGKEIEEIVSEEKLIVLPEKIVNASGTFHFSKILPLDLSTYFENAPSEASLRETAISYMENNNIGTPKVSLTVSFVQLEQAEEYEQLILLEKVKICDTVNIIFSDLGVNATAKCVKTKYNAITDKYESLEFGDARTNFADNIVDQSEAIEKLPSLGFLQDSILRATQLITGGLGGYVILHSSTGSSTPDELLVLEPESKGDYLKANRIWRFNYAGLGYSSNGYNGPYGLAMTIDGQINASFVNTGQLNVGGSGQAEKINVYDASGTKRLVVFDEHGITLENGTQINWGDINKTGMPDYQTSAQVTASISSATGNLASKTSIAPLFTSVETLYYSDYTDGDVVSRPSLPSKPTSQVSRTDKVWQVWTKTCCDPDTTLETRSGKDNKYRWNCYFFMCVQYKKQDGSYTWGDVTEVDNTNNTTIITKNTITTSYINALNVTAINVSATYFEGKSLILGGAIDGNWRGNKDSTARNGYNNVQWWANGKEVEQRSYYTPVYNGGKSGGVSGVVINANNYFLVTKDGALYASNSYIEGTIYANAGRIGGFTINDEVIYDNHLSDRGVWIYPAGKGGSDYTAAMMPAGGIVVGVAGLGLIGIGATDNSGRPSIWRKMGDGWQEVQWTSR